MNYLLGKTGILANFVMTIGLGFVLGLLAAGQTFYTFVLDTLRHTGALRAMRASHRTVLRMLCVQVAAAGRLGYGLGRGSGSITGACCGRVGLACQMPWSVRLF